jgi:hypothetical protein
MSQLAFVGLLGASDERTAPQLMPVSVARREKTRPVMP